MITCEREDDGGEEQDKATTMHTLSTSGATEVCLDLTANRLDILLHAQVMKLLSALVLREEGVPDVQKNANKHPTRQVSHLLFQQGRTT